MSIEQFEFAVAVSIHQREKKVWKEGGSKKNRLEEARKVPRMVWSVCGSASRSEGQTIYYPGLHFSFDSVLLRRDQGQAKTLLGYAECLD